MATIKRTRPAGTLPRRLFLGAACASAGACLISGLAKSSEFAPTEDLGGKRGDASINVAAIQLRRSLSLPENLARMCASIARTQQAGERKDLICFGADILADGDDFENGADPAVFDVLADAARHHDCAVAFGAPLSAHAGPALALIEPSGRITIAARGIVTVKSRFGDIALMSPAQTLSTSNAGAFQGVDMSIYAPLRQATAQNDTCREVGPGASVTVTTVDATAATSSILGSLIRGPAGEIRAAASAAWEQVVVARIPRRGSRANV